MKRTKICLSILAGMFSLASFAQFNYGEALQKSLLFYETQQSGVLPDWNRINWRSNSGVNDGADVGLDLTGGWNDAGDHVKFGFPMAFSITALNWGFLEYKDGYDAVNQTEIYKRNIKWVTDYFIKCHPSPNVFYAQVADSKSQDHNFWMPAEMVDVHPQYGERKSYAITSNNPGTEVACETAAALASASIVFKDSDPEYSALLLQHAKELYEFGDTYRGLYTDENAGGIPADGTYTSSSFKDELTWGALWLYKATGEQQYLDKAEAEYSEPDYLWSLVWEDKTYGNMVLLSIITDKENYKQNAERHLDWWQKENGGVSYSPGGQANLTPWGSSRHAMNASLTALIYSDNVNTSKEAQYHDFAVDQLNYILGDNPMERSLVTGFGVNPPTMPHHRGQHSSWTRKEENPIESRHTMWGALMGGPLGPNDTFVEDRGDFQANEVATDYNACYTGVLARMIMEFGGSELPDFPQPEPAGLEYANEVKINNDQSRFTEVAIWLNNRSGWPARVPNSLKARYFIDITEGIAAGFNVDDYVITARGAGSATTSNLQEWDVDSNIYYVEIEVDQESMPFPGGQGEYRSEIQMRIALPNDAPEAAWDASNDFSYQGLDDSLKISNNVPIYENGVLAGGNEPNGGETPTALFTTNIVSGIAPLEVAFNGATSSDPNGDSITYSWDFGNGQTATEVAPSIIYTEIGSYLVSLKVSDGENTSTAFTTTITVEDGNVAPIASFIATPTTGIAPVTVSFDGSASSDENEDELTYTWDFGDGEFGTGVTISHQYVEVGEYSAVLTVSDGSKYGTISEKVIVTDGSPVAAFTVSSDAGIAPFEVTFDATTSIDPTGGDLTYNWNFGNGETATTASASTTYTELGQATVTLTVTNTDGDTDTETRIINVTDGSVSCGFETPIASGLPSVDEVFTNVYVLGNGGPNLENIARFTINWNLENNGLYQLSINTNNGSPNWWNDLAAVVTQSFNAPQPEITVTGSGFVGFDGSYYVTIDQGNFVMVSKSGGFTIYFSNTATAPNCGGVATNTPIMPNGGTITGGPFEFIVGDGIADNVSGVSLTGTEGSNFQWIVTDNENKILGLPNAIEGVDFDGAGAGTCLIWHLSYADGLEGLMAENNLSDFVGDFDLSNSITVVRNLEETNDGSCTFNTPITSALASIDDRYENIFVLGSEGPDVSNIRQFSINWNLEANGLYQFALNTKNGTPGWYVDLTDSLIYSFNSAQPEATLSGTQITGLDGAYWVTVDGGSFVMVSKTGNYAIYFTNDSAPNCSEFSAKNLAYLVQTGLNIFPNPASDFVTIQSEITNSKYVLLTMEGKIVASKMSEGEKVIFNVSSLASGIYILQEFKGNRLLRVEKIVKN